MVTRQPDHTRSRLLEAAFAEIHQQGFQGASLTRILEGTGLTKGALYHHFPTKQELGLAVVDEVIHERLDAILFTPLRQGADPIGTLLALIRARAADASPATVRLGCPLNNLMQEMSPVDPQFRARLTRVLEDWTAAVESALRRGQAQGQLRAGVDCREAALFITAAWEGCFGVCKNLQSVPALTGCLRQLEGYVRGLLMTP
ncbi:MAG: TetR family transcriptional regulator C-terminal domain-containing protein [Gammaproteobacteria bacterium]|nr:TetR/AcrR family transcriptional regulator [Gammaproteobacteria bacterium]